MIRGSSEEACVFLENVELIEAEDWDEFAFVVEDLQGQTILVIAEHLF